MRGMDSINKIPIIEINDHTVEKPCTKLTVKNHWNWSDRVVLEFNRLEITVDAQCLKRAIDNAVNAHF